MATWPLALPDFQTPLDDQQEDPYLRSEMDVGPGKTRKRYTGEIRNLNPTITIDGMQRAILDDLFNRSITFQKEDPKNGALKTYRFLTAPKYRLVTGSNFPSKRVYEVTLNLKAMPGSTGGGFSVLIKDDYVNSAVNFTRNTIGRAWGSDGYLDSYGADEIRYNYNPATGLYEGIPIMGQWTNEILDPRDMTTGNWVGDAGNGVANATRDATGIDGNDNTANTITPDGVTGADIRQSITVSDNSNAHVFGMFVRKDTGNAEFSAELRFGGTFVNAYSIFDTETGNVVSGSLTVEDYDQWWFVWNTITNNSTGNTKLDIVFYPDVDNYTDAKIVDAAQVFLNRSTPPPTPVYGETAGQSYTQDPDIATVTDLDAIDFNPQEGTFVVEFDYAGNTIDSTANGIFGLSDGTTNNRISLRTNPSLRSNLVVVSTNGSTEANTSTDGDYLSDGFNKLAVSISEQGIQTSVNGILSTSTGSIAMPTLSKMYIGATEFADPTQIFIKSLQYYPRRLTNAQLQQLTS